jgi:hypothetical protein
MIFFDYLYYKASKFYARYDRDGAGISGVIIVALMQWLNIFSVYLIIRLIRDQPIGASRLIVVLSCIFLLIMNGIRYSRLNRRGLRERWDGETENKRARGNLLIVFYVFLSFALTVALTAYIGDRNNP